MVFANLLRAGGGFLPCCSCNPLAYPSLPKPLHSSCFFISKFPSPLPTSKLTAAATQRRHHFFLTFCSVSDAFLAPVAPLLSETPASGAKEGSNCSSSFTPLSPDTQSIKDVAKMLDIRVGRILKASKHPEAESLYIEEVDVGEPEPRIICSGLVNYIPLEYLQGIEVVVLANLKPRNMRGIKSFGMVLAASDDSHKNVELLVPSHGSVPGERIWFGSEDEKEKQLGAATPNQVQKKKIWELVQPHLKTDASGATTLGEDFMRTSKGLVMCRSLKHANIS